MKNILLLTAVLIMIGGYALADNRLTPNISIQELTENSGSNLTNADFFLGFDTSSNDFVKSDPTDSNMLSGTIDGVVIGGSTPAAGDFTTLGATGAATLTSATFSGTVGLNGATVLGDGATVHSGFLTRQVASTTAAITAAQCSDHFVSDSADVMTLPEASTVLGCTLKFTCGTADDFDINPADGTDTIASISTTNGTTAVVTLAPSAGDAIRCTDIGSSITIEAIGADLWAQVAGGNGIWTDVN